MASEKMDAYRRGLPAMAGGAAGGALLGLLEAVVVLGWTSTGEYLALLVAVLLYGIAGLFIGLVLMPLVWMLGRGFGNVSLHTAWSLGAAGAFSGLGVPVSMALLHRSGMVQEDAVRPWIGLIGVWFAIFLMAFWLCSVFLKQVGLHWCE